MRARMCEVTEESAPCAALRHNPTHHVAVLLQQCPGFVNARLTSIASRRYVGIWAEGKPTGDGSYTYTNGDAYTGTWAAGVRSGRGTYKFSKDDSFIVGEWDGDTLVRGTWKTADGSQVDFFV